ncbi:RNA polymerase sigma-70 factor [Pedobacter sp.]|jgi:RNA polymerase sigma-70 factor (ECF subfamily)|uniref:RNA polymerase sigma factor n=1 Tax=Pedobacter sp. TaxID=1411316 RepID=UPI002C969DB8|nr:RNA polymerase sigma-70 factor [Pedobacter sp.]HWW38923.1 RNA polymerase sigma-70 factor [Pedobacter sp.]
MAPYTTLSDAELTVLLKQQDQRAYTVIYERYWALLFRHACKMIKDEEQAADVIQDLFTIMWTQAETLEINTSLASYLYTSLRNRILKLIRREKVQINYLITLPDFEKEGHNITDEILREKELQMQIEKEIEMLPSKMREIFELSRNAHMSYKQIAEEINITEGTVKKQVYNALKILRARLGMTFFMGIMKLILFFFK